MDCWLQSKKMLLKSRGSEIVLKKMYPVCLYLSLKMQTPIVVIRLSYKFLFCFDKTKEFMGKRVNRLSV